MKFWHALCSITLLVLFCVGALAQEDPESVYAKLHRAALAGKADEVLSYGTAAQQAELAKLPKEQKEAVIGFLSKMLPATYTITEKTIAPDGNSAILRATGVVELIGKSDSYLLANFKKEGGVWKVDKWSWTGNKPPGVAAKPAAAVAAAPLPQTVAAPMAVVPEKLAATRAATSGAEAPALPRRHSRSNEDARVCLKQPTDRAIMACAEKYR
jgi:hypothetical protein